MKRPMSPDGLRTLASRRRAQGNSASAGMLELAASLWEAAESTEEAPWYRMFGSRQPSTDGVDLQSTFAAWSDSCGEVLAAMSRSLVGAESCWKGSGVPVPGEGLPFVAERLVVQSRSVNEALGRIGAALRSEGIELVRRASNVGSLERSVQHERGRLQEDLDRGADLEEAIRGLGTERLRAAERVASLQERLRLARATTAERETLLKRVVEMEEVTRKEKAESDELEKRLKVLERESAELGERVVRTRALIVELEKSPDRELSRRVQEVWRLLPPDAVPRGTNIG